MWPWLVLTRQALFLARDFKEEGQSKIQLFKKSAEFNRYPLCLSPKALLLPYPVEDQHVKEVGGNSQYLDGQRYHLDLIICSPGRGEYTSNPKLGHCYQTSPSSHILFPFNNIKTR